MIFMKNCTKTKCSLSKLVSFFRDQRRNKFLTPSNVNPNLRKLDDAIFEDLLQRKAKQLETKLKKGSEESFGKITRLNIKDLQSLEQPPITFLRQILALVSYPDLLNNKSFPEDVKRRARNVLEKCPGYSIGSYSDACGIEIIRRQVAEYIEERDSISSHWRNCIIGHGANDLFKKFLKMLGNDLKERKPGILYPVPGYPPHSAIMEELGIETVKYYLEESDWDISLEELERAIEESRKKCNPRAILIMNPGNPTSTILNRMNMEKIIKFAHKEKLIIIADEIYQNDILKNSHTFHSFKKVSNEMGEPYSKMELVSLASISNCIYGENGLKCGFAECINFKTEIYPMLTKQISSYLCPSILGQTALYAMVNPPKEHEPSYELYKREITSIKKNLQISATILEESLNQLEGVSCNQIQGAVYAFPRINFPKIAEENAEKMKLSPDVYYAFELLNRTGICVSPGKNFGQLPGTYHIRMVVTPQPDNLLRTMGIFTSFHKEFMTNLKN